MSMKTQQLGKRLRATSGREWMRDVKYEDPSKKPAKPEQVGPPKDCQGKTLKVGQKVARANKLYAQDGLYVEVVKVTKIEDNKVYLAGSTKPLKFPDRICILGA